MTKDTPDLIVHIESVNSRKNRNTMDKFKRLIKMYPGLILVSASSAAALALSVISIRQDRIIRLRYTPQGALVIYFNRGEPVEIGFIPKEVS